MAASLDTASESIRQALGVTLDGQWPRVARQRRGSELRAVDGAGVGPAPEAADLPRPSNIFDSTLGYEGEGPPGPSAVIDLVSAAGRLPLPSVSRGSGCPSWLSSIGKRGAVSRELEPDQFRRLADVGGPKDEASVGLSPLGGLGSVDKKLKPDRFRRVADGGSPRGEIHDGERQLMPWRRSAEARREPACALGGERATCLPQLAQPQGSFYDNDEPRPLNIFDATLGYEGEGPPEPPRVTYLVTATERAPHALRGKPLG